jgi:hypothetical protein
MKKIARILPLVGILCFSLNAYEYVYPVGTFIDYEGEIGILSLYQKTPDHTELWQSNLGIQEPFVMQEVNRALLSTFTPVGVAMLPDNAGFSFFDNGRLRIKNFLKRSPKAIDIYEPIYDIGPLHWLTTDVCIFHAKEREEFSLYQLYASDGSVTKIVSKEASDCFYPSQIGSSLFYIEHRHEKESVERESIEGDSVEKDSAEKSEYFLMKNVDRLNCPTQCSDDASSQCLLTHDKPLAFLTMVDEHHGLVIEHAMDVDSQKDKVLACTCHQVTCADSLNSASLVKLFSFTLPLSLLLPSSKARLCESLYPLLPRKIGETIYFVNCVDDEMRPFCYTDRAGVQPLLFEAQSFGDLFTPLPIFQSSQECLIYGGSLQREFLRDDQEPAEALILVTL